MSDLRKVAEMHYQYEQRREFKFESYLGQWLKRTMVDNEITMFTLAKASGLSAADISSYKNDYKILDIENAKKLAKGLRKFMNFDHADTALIAWQRKGEFVDMVEERKKHDEFLASINGGDS